MSNVVCVRALGTRSTGLLPFPDGELFLSGQRQPLGTRSLQWHTAGWHRCYSSSGCGRWPWFSSPWSPRTTSWLLPHAAVAGGGTQFGLSPVSKHSTGSARDRKAQVVWSTQQLFGKAGWGGLWKGVGSYERARCTGGQSMQVWVWTHLAPGAWCCLLMALPALPQAPESVQETNRSSWAMWLLLIELQPVVLVGSPHHSADA